MLYVHTVIIAASLGMPPSADAAARNTLAAAVAWSKDENSIAIGYRERLWNFNRPQVYPWTYKVVRNIYWVASNGASRNAGTAEAPFKTIGQAINWAGPGDIIYVQPGTYIEHLEIKKTGHDGKPIIISCAPGALGKVIITPPAAWVAANVHGSVVEVTNKARYIWINGFVIQGRKGFPEAPQSEHYSANGITWSNGAGFGCRATNNVVYGNLHCGLKEMNHGGSNILMEGNVIFDNGSSSLDHGIYCPASDCTIDGNIIFNNTGWGIHAYEWPKRLAIYRNIVVNNGSGGIVLSTSSSKVYNNIVAFNMWGLLYFRDSCTNNIVTNNILAFNSSGADCGYDNGGDKLGDPANNIDDYNCCFPSKPDPRIPPGKHELLADPQFRDPKRGDFRLLVTSPCIRSGADVGLPFKGQTPDLGPFDHSRP